MSMDAVALLRLPLEKVTEALGRAQAPEGGPTGAVWLEGPERPVAFVALDDGVLLFSGVALQDVELEVLGEGLRDLLGALLDQHDDERGVLIFPERARPADATSYDAIAEEAGDLGDWVTPPSEMTIETPGMPPGLEDMMGQMMGALGADPSQMGGLWAQAQKMMANPEMQSELMGAAQAMMGKMQGQQGLDLSSLASQAQELMGDDPELVERLKGQLESPGDVVEPTDDDAKPSDDDGKPSDE
jgi:hypothetical protein